MMYNKEFFKNFIVRLIPMFEEHRDYLSKLDSDIGDGDHGINMSIGFREVQKQLDKLYEETEDISSFYRKVGMIILGKVGGAAGPLYGSLFMKAGDDVKGKNELTFEELVGFIENGIKSIEMRGKAVVGDKTMVDALRPAIDQMKEELGSGKGDLEIFESFVNELKEGSDKTIPLVAKKGRAMRLGERAIGFRDPGSFSSYLIYKEMLDEMKSLAEG
ncbi:dihydroxyacetone kinase subunit L [Proteiniclasticum sp. SCR006]|uniref:phosphoenolpyruvate--glycerone phosphotransferase n=1 Tax=Proteiniclasticum aestuarii TaxID=2817862 RepID=A0A939HAC2_9CLOT|nr:dihydroxyacetone kinase subunit DhaL [Proteiniclasticum aestuarii]MBO1263960.1 dihydroxyacetone kinase subunit L [Proteiniclasticum aestuarii]